MSQEESTQFALGQLIALAIALLMLTAIVIVTVPARADEGLDTSALAAIVEPVGDGAVTGNARPAGDTAKRIVAGPELILRRFELIKRAVPGIARIGVLWQSDAAGENTRVMLQDVGKAALATGVSVQFIGISDLDQLEIALSEISSGQVDALIVMPSTTAAAERRYIVESIAKTSLPAIYAAREFVQDGGLMSFTAQRPVFGDTAPHREKILKQVNPADLPDEQPEKFELVVNLKTASRLGTSLNREFLALVDRIME
jgi:putative ABC transport system substrate-binding protein